MDEDSYLLLSERPEYANQRWDKSISHLQNVSKQPVVISIYLSPKSFQTDAYNVKAFDLDETVVSITRLGSFCGTIFHGNLDSISQLLLFSEYEVGFW